MAHVKMLREKLPDFTVYCMVMGCGFLWQVNAFDAERSRMCWFRLRLHWRGLAPRREWALYSSEDSGIEWYENSPVRKGAWVLRGPWVKVA